jgi:hypothetical protein
MFAWLKKWLCREPPAEEYQFPEYDEVDITRPPLHPPHRYYVADAEDKAKRRAYDDYYSRYREEYLLEKWRNPKPKHPKK